MAPLATRRRTSSSSSTSIKPRPSRISRTRKPRRTRPSSHFNNQNPQISRINDDVEDSPSPSSSEVVVAAAADELASPAASSCCSTPKGHKFRIPEASTCPPAPKKKKPRSLLSSNSNFSLRRSPISFFAPPDLELFFFLSLPAST